MLSRPRLGMSGTSTVRWRCGILDMSTVCCLHFPCPCGVSRSNSEVLGKVCLVKAFCILAQKGSSCLNLWCLPRYCCVPLLPVPVLTCHGVIEEAGGRSARFISHPSPLHKAGGEGGWGGGVGADLKQANHDPHTHSLLILSHTLANTASTFALLRSSPPMNSSSASFSRVTLIGSRPMASSSSSPPSAR